MTQPTPIHPGETPEQHAHFEARIARGEKIEPGDWMPAEYRRQLIRMISQHAHSEVVGMLPEGEWIARAPTLKRKTILMAKVQDEAGHGQYLYHAAETLGATREDMLAALLAGKAKYSSIFNYPTRTWADVGMIGWLVDGAAIKNQTMLAGCSYGPYSRAMVRICSEETFHHKQGKEMIVAYAQGTPEQRAMAQDALNRWWWPAVMMLGPHDADSPNTGALSRWGIKLKSNDEVRQEFINEHVPELLEAGLTIPDPDLHRDERGNWIHGPVNWDEFWAVIRGEQGLHRERLGTRQAAHDDGAWVREALQAYTDRQRAVAAD
ncbi:ring-1,2-phenylacetyl-CoA epoxidase subunit PaaA [Deinococcus metalli]|uniref:Phenylacetate-CoA oxygenase subunit PaaA n=1 Tax=Deinococcus metalli TaxID=1141878 RepID=A0A7W8KIE5_9DEIO|nr:1,2-phenylacetyl-CoA epoxidase subunit PaaA [Deinococcus metalli]MBB5378313.1 ring-1,2-phenylacetyl-CoA epoxidase subunit PaaA [Deinococcus metalli]GHF59790.1 phenylacetate-CoA oxygenase subunit PaaA [Deinococcus metalli]